VSALSTERMSGKEHWGSHSFPLASGNKAYKNGLACIDLSTGKVEPAHAETDLFVIGKFERTVDATAGEKQVSVAFWKEIVVEWLENDTEGTPVVAADVGSLCYLLDDQTVTGSSAGNSVAGRVWAIDATRGVAVERLQAVPAAVASLDGLGGVDTDPGAFAAGDLVIDDNPNSGAVYELPATAANSTVTLPAAADEGAIVHFVADGILNGHTVQYRDATGPANLTTALTASKRHQVTAIFLNGKWRANAYVSP
jgi:hypothetical protein